MQFEDAPEDYTAPVVPRSAQHSRIDDEQAAADLSSTIQQTSSPAADTSAEPNAGPAEATEAPYDSDEYYYSEDDVEEEEQYGLEDGLREVMDQDWADASGDFTKRYNRMKQQVVATRSPLAAVPGTPATAQSNSKQPTAAVLPALNRARRQPTATSQTAQNTAANAAGGGGGAQHHGNKVTDQLTQLQHRFANRLQLEPLHSQGTATRKGGSEKILVKDKSDRATNEQVLDPRTRLIIFKMLGRGLLERVDGCVSTGKEANVYHAVSPEGKHLALKIYKTSILVFKDRDRYVTGEFRFKNGYARSNPRKMVRLWAEKELRNLRRMRTAGLRVPEAIEVRENVLVMDFIQEDEWQASPRLKDASIPPELMPSLYVEILQILRILFHRCRLVHADFSEYNILYHDSHLWIIDVSQSIEQEHPAAFDFLRSDLKNAEEWFSRRGVRTLGLRKTFGFVTGDSWIKDRQETDDDVKVEIERLLAEQLESQADEDEGAEEPSRLEETAGDIAEAQANASSLKKKKTATTESDEAVFAQSYIPRALDDVYDPERDVQRVLRGEGQDLIYADITGVAQIHGQEVRREGEDDEGEGSGSEHADSDVSDGDEDDESGEDGDKERRPRGKKHEDKDEKKKRRQEVKEKAREKRATKMSKSEKNRRMKKSSGKR
ncbi:hypothetical protein JCM11491_000985 [Sporobolomyces phaffii]